MNVDELLIPGSYRQKIRKINDKLAELEEGMVTIKGHDFDVHRRSSRPGAYFEDTVIKHDEVYTELIQVTTDYIDAKNRLREKIERLKDQTYADLLLYRFVLGFSIKELTETFDCNERWVYRMLKQAKEEFERIDDGEL